MARTLHSSKRSTFMRNAAAAGNLDQRLAVAFRTNDNTVSQVVRPVAALPETRDQILVGFDLLEQSLQ